MFMILFLSNIFILNIVEINSHGLLLVPPARSSAWRQDPLRFPTYYNDMEMFCGGKPTQWNQNGGKCSICGEDYAKSKRFEKGGDMYRGNVVKTYKNTENIDITLDIWTNHRGWYEFRLCNVDNMSTGEATQECLDKILLRDTTGATRFNTPNHISPEGKGTAYLTLKIPAGFKCNHCVLQWKWNVGNSHGNDFVTGEWCMGCGPQEQFYGCSDIRITSESNSDQVQPTQPPQPQTVLVTNSNEVAALYGQCGGVGWTGPTQCASGLHCKPQNQYYSQCLA